MDNETELTQAPNPSQEAQPSADQRSKSAIKNNTAVDADPPLQLSSDELKHVRHVLAKHFYHDRPA